MKFYLQYCVGFVALCFTLLGATATAAEAIPPGSVPDLTRAIDFERKGEFYLGPTGCKGWIYTGSNFMTTDARQILITQVSPGSAADGKLQAGDVILGAGGKLFTSDARRSLGRAIDEAETAENRGILKLIRWRPVPGVSPRKGTRETIALKLKVMGSYSDTAPWGCPKTQRILDDSLKALVEKKDFGRFGASALALLATGEKEYINVVREYIHSARWAKPDIKVSIESGSKSSWSCGYQNLLLTEYFLATGDKYVLPAIREYAIKTAMGQSIGGTWGHGFAWTKHNGGKLHGPLSGYGALNAAGLPCFLSLVLAKKCGIEHREIDDAIARSSRFFEKFVDNGSIGYGYHRPSLEVHASGKNGMSGNGKNGIAAIAFHLRGDRKAARFFSRLTASLYNTCEYGHSGNSYSYYWDPLGANCGGPALVSAFLKELRWYYALTRQADGSFVNQPLGGHYGGRFLDPTAAQILIATLPRRAICLTGKGQKRSDWLNAEETKETIDAGRWRLANTDDMSSGELISKLDSWSPIAREWVAKSLAKKDGEVVGKLVQLLKEGSPEARAGACAALGHLGDRAVAAVPSLSKAVSDKEPIVGIAASYALARIGRSAQNALPDMLRAVLKSEETGLMRPKQQALAYALGYDSRVRTAPLYFDGLLPQIGRRSNPLDGVDRELLYPAIAKLLDDPSGRTRGCGALAFQYFNREDTAFMAQHIYDAIKRPSLSFMMFEDAPRNHALDLLARFRIKEGLPLCFETLGLKRWGQFARIPARFQTLQAYRGSAKPYLPQLRELRARWRSGEHRDMLEKTIKIIEEDSGPPKLISLRDLVDERLAKDLTPARTDEQRVVLCRKLMAQHPNDYFYQAAGLRKLVAIRGSEAIEDVSEALASPDDILQETAVVLAATLPGIKTGTWIGMLANEKGRKLAGVIEVLGRSKDPKAAGTITKYLEHEDSVVREAAKRAVTRLNATTE